MLSTAEQDPSNFMLGNKKREMDECRILEDAELDAQANRLEWRRASTNRASSLFQVKKPLREFPNAFSIQRAAPTSRPFPFKPKVARRVDVSGVVIRTGENRDQIAVQSP